MEKQAIIAEISKLNVSQRAAVRKLVPAVVAGRDFVAVTKAKRGAHVYIRLGGADAQPIISTLLGPRGRVVELKQRRV